MHPSTRHFFRSHPLPVAGRVFTRPAIAVAAVCALALSGTTAANAATTDPNPSERELTHAALSARAATEGMVLLENHGQALPMAKTGNVAVFGVGAYKTVKGGTGSGAVNNRYTITVRQALEDAGYGVTTSDTYWDAMTQAYDEKYGNSEGGIFGPTIDYSSVEQPLTAETVAPTAATDTAIFVVARNSGEGADRSPGVGDYELRDVEHANIKLIGETYQRVIVVLNVGGIVDTSFFAEINDVATDPTGATALDALLLMSQAGQESGDALVDVLDGTATPSGKLADTWAAKYAYYPAAAAFANADGDPLNEQYTEGIYVGYRYFDSFYRAIDATDPAGVVNYPFGYGLSYTDFTIRTLDVKATMASVTVKAKVTNTGATASGKEVVQVYVSAPQSGPDKPYQELAGYAKTDTLAPGASQTVTIRFTTTELSSYDPDRAAYVMDAGDYVVRVGNSSRNTQVVAKLNLKRTTTTELVTNQQDDSAPAEELTSDPKNFYTYPAEAEQIARAERIVLDTNKFRTTDSRSEYDQDVAVDESSPYYALDGDTISSTTVYLNRSQQDWEGTGQPYQPKTGEKVRYVRTNSDTTLYDVAKGRATIEQFVAGLSVTQLANIVEGASLGGSTLSAVGAAGYTTSAYENLGIAAMSLADGPAGLRLTQQITSTDPVTYQYATAWPIGTALAQTWNPELLRQVGTAIGAEMAEFGATLWLAPGMNIHRDPLNGRNFEYYSEDPLITGMTATAVTQGVQSVPGVGVTIKHYAANSQETNRTTSDSVIGERALREIYLKGFEISVKSAQPMAVMTSYNKINGWYTAASYDLDTDILRGEWGFKGLVMTDWGAGPRAGIAGVMYAGNDLVEPGRNPTEVINSVMLTGQGVRLGDLQRSAATILGVVTQSAPFAELASLQGVRGIKVGSYTAQFRNLAEYVSQSRGAITVPQPKVTLEVSGTAGDQGWYRGSVSVKLTLTNGVGATAYVSVDGKKAVPYTEPVTVSGDGVHTVHAWAVASDGKTRSKTAALTIRIDGTPPTVTVTKSSNGRLALKAKDTVSGVRSIEYSLDGGKHWTRYTSEVKVSGTPRTVSYRAIDLAGNVSDVGTVRVTSGNR